jgi:hypothetical protein
MPDLVRPLALFALLSCAACGRDESVEPTVVTPSALPRATARTSDEAPPLPSAAPPSFDSEQEVSAFCRQFSALSLPPADQPSATERRALAKCDAEKLYYGVGVRPDYVAARKCAYAELERKDASPFGGAHLLMTLYANGRGVPTNFDLALKFACTRDTNESARARAIQTIWKARAGAGLSKVLDVCDFEAVTPAVAACLSRDSRIAGAKRDERKAKATMGLKSRELAFLEKAAKDFFEARARSELDLSGTGRAMFAIEEKDRLADDYVDLLEKLADPKFSPPRAEGSEARLVAFHARLLGCKELKTPWARDAGLSQRELASTQRAWTKYRDAWLALVAKARPRTAIPAWRALLVEQRIRMLETVPLCQKS